jgi:uncharacterized protein (TIGR03435 family)
MRCAALMILDLLVVANVGAQGPTSVPRFDAVSIKPNTSRESGIMSRPTPGRLVLTNAPVSVLIEQAYRTDYQHLFNLPDWAKNERWDILATYDAAQRQDVGLMAQAMLADRFQLQVHRETRAIPVYVLERVRPDALGRNLHASTANCADRSGGQSPCRTRIAPGLIDATGANWGFLPTNIGVGDRPVVDKTGLTGAYDIKLEWNATTILGSTDPGLSTTEKPSIFQALEDQLGLRLRAAREPVEIVVVDRIGRPSAD